jgi:hypothetical protein
MLRHGWAEEVRRQSWSPVYGQKAAATVVVFSVTAELPREFCTVLVTLDEALRKPGKFEQIDDQKSDSGVRAYRFSTESDEFQFFYSESGRPWRHSGLASDAEFLCQCRRATGAQQLILVNGTYAEVIDTEMRFRRLVAWGELNTQDNRREILSSEPDAVSDEVVVSAQTESDSVDVHD